VDPDPMGYGSADFVSECFIVDPDPVDPSLNGFLNPDSQFRITDPQIRIRKKYLRIHTTGLNQMLCIWSN
jgi:hypothetical protein